MSSGNFEIGKNLSLEGFKEYVEPNLKKYKTQITDILSYSEKGDKKVLVALIGDSSTKALENIVKISLDEAYVILHEKEMNGDDKKSAWAYQVKDFEGEKFNIIGLYQDNETASKIFQNLAVEYSTKNLDFILDEAKREIKQFGEKFNRF